MHRVPFALLIVLVCISPTFANGPVPVSRRDGFLLLWESIRRPALPTREKPFADVSKGERGFDEITYAKNRGIPDDDETFRPDDPLLLSDALIWLFRTRNIDEPANITEERLAQLITTYDLDVGSTIDTDNDENFGIQKRNIPMEDLLNYMRVLDIVHGEEQHEVSLYGEKFHGKGTAFGENFDMHALTAAHRTFPHNTLVKVTNIENDKSVTVRINDRGPFVEGRDMDLSVAAFTAIAQRSKGKFMARFQRLGDAALVVACDMDLPAQQMIARGTRFTSGVPHVLRLGQTLILNARQPFLVRSVTYPDGLETRTEDWVLPEERYELTPSVAGDYRFRLRAKDGKGREMVMRVADCGKDG